jgi:hypothetical protein
LPKSGKDVLCVQCAEKKRAIEAELNSGQQMQINFTSESSWTAFDKPFIQNLKDKLDYYTTYKNLNPVKVEDSYWGRPPSVYVEKSGKSSKTATGVSEMYKPWVVQPWVSYKVMYDVHKGSPAKEISAEIGSKEVKSTLQDPVKMTVKESWMWDKTAFYEKGLKGELQYPDENESVTKKNLKNIAAHKPAE